MNTHLGLVGTRTAVLSSLNRLRDNGVPFIHGFGNMSAFRTSRRTVLMFDGLVHPNYRGKGAAIVIAVRERDLPTARLMISARLYLP